MNPDPLVRDLQTLLDKFPVAPPKNASAYEVGVAQGRREVIHHLANQGLPSGKVATIKEVITVNDVSRTKDKDARTDRPGRSPRTG